MKRRILSLLISSVLLLVSCGSAEKSAGKGEYDIIIVGAGGGGLAAAAQLTRAGKKVLIIEQHYKVGGYMTNFTRGDYTFEISLHAMDNLNPGRMNIELFKNLGIYDKVKPVRADPIGKIFFPGSSVIVPADPEKYRQLLIERFPKDKESIDNFYEATRKMDEVVNASLYFMKGEYITGIWECLKHITAFGPFFRHRNSTTNEFLRDYIKNEELLGFIATLTGMLGDSLDNVSGLMFAGMWNGYQRGGYYYFEGGSQSITDALENIIRNNHGEILLSTLVTKIIVEDGRAVGVKTEDVRTKEKKEFRSRYVISNANAPDTFFKLVGKKNLPKDYAENLKKMKIGPSSFLVYLGVNKDYTGYYPGNSHELMINYSIDSKENFKAWETGDISKIPFGVANYSKINPNAAPRGKNTLVLTSIMSYDCYNNWMKGEPYEKYKKLKTDLAKTLIKRLEPYLPGLSSHIEVMEVATPRTNERFTLNPKGSLFGWANTVDQSMWNRLPQTTPIKNLYLAGAWTLPCGGQSVVLMSGYTAAKMILEKE